MPPSQSKQNAPQLGQVPLQANLDALLNLARQQARNPDPITDYFRIPDRLPPTWQTFFDKVLKYVEKSCNRESATTDLMGKAGMAAGGQRH
jgi:hypothetical protein